MEPALRLLFIAHLAVLINGKPVHRTQKTEVIALCQWAFTACLFLSQVQKTFALDFTSFILHVDHGMSLPLYAMHLLIYYIYLEASSTALLFLSFYM